jgi:5-methylcytosine-specific restriction endonuclease McrA
MPMSPRPACLVCRRVGCTDHPRQSWDHNKPTPRIRGRQLQALRYELFREHPFCQQCHTAVATIRDHIVALNLGGTDTRENTQALCANCNEAKRQLEAKRGRYPATSLNPNPRN